MQWFGRQLKLFFARPISVVDCWDEEDEDMVRWCFKPRYFWQPRHPEAKATVRP